MIHITDSRTKSRHSPRTGGPRIASCRAALSDKFAKPAKADEADEADEVAEAGMLWPEGQSS